MLHITNGDSAAAGIRETGLEGKVLSWIDVLHEGPVPSDLDLAQLRTVRAQFIASCGWTSFEEAVALFSRRDQVLAESLGQDEVILWFEHDLYDQLQLLQILDWFAHQELDRTKLTIICGAEYLGPSTVERLRERYPERQTVSQAQLELARAAWASFRSSDPIQLTDLLQQESSALPFLASALRRHLQQFPSQKNGLSRSENQALEVIASGATTLGQVYRQSHHDREEAVFLGDDTFAVYVERLSAGRKPLVLWEDGQIIRAPRGRSRAPEFWESNVMLTPLGRAVLEGAADQVELNGIDRWLGGVHLSGTEARYRWDEGAQRLVVLIARLSQGMAKLTSVGPVSDEDTSALPVKNLAGAIAFYQNLLGFTVVSRDSSRAVLVRDHVQIGILLKVDHERAQAGSIAFAVDDLDAMRSELHASGANPGKLGLDEWSGKRHRTFFVREAENGYCY